MASFDELFEQLQAGKAWGTLTFLLKDGEVKKITYQRDFLGVEDALEGLATTPMQKSPDEEEPTGERRAVHSRIPQNGHALSA